MAKHKNSSTPFLRFLFLLYAALLLWLLFDRSVDWTEGIPYRQQIRNNVNLIPFHTIKQYWKIVRLRQYNDVRFFHGVINLAGNIILFIPIGYFLPRLWVKMRKFFPFLFTCTLSICLVELLQLLTLLGSMDIDDLILNLAGMILGYLAYTIPKR